MTTLLSLLAVVRGSEYLFYAPICLAIALVTAAAHREDMREIFRQAIRSCVLLMAGMYMFGLLISYLFEWILPG